jgi:hypothetical protein
VLLLTGVMLVLHPLVHLEIDSCVEVDQAEARRVLGIELGALLTDEGPAPDRTHVGVGCDEAGVRLTVDDPTTSKSLVRTIDLGSAAAKARARLLALAIAELITASWTELRIHPAPVVKPVGPRAPPEAKQAVLAAMTVQSERSLLLRLRVMARGGGMAFFSGTGVLGGAGVLVGQDFKPSVGWQSDVQALHATTGTSLGAVSTDVIALGAALVVHYTWRRMGVRGGVGLRGGAVRMAGEGMGEEIRANSLWGPFGGVMGTLSLGVAATRRLALEVGIEGGYVLVPVAGLVDGRRAVAIEGGWVGFHAGVGIFP